MDRYTFATVSACLVVFLALSPLGAGTKPIVQWTSYSYPIQFEHVSVEQGLSQSSVNCITQDTRGFLWFGTDDGLNRYDGYNFVVFRHDPADAFSLGNNRVLALFEDRNGVLWVGTAGGGLNRYDRDRNRFVRYTHDPVTYYQQETPRELSNNTIRCIVEARDGGLWLGTDGSGLGLFQWKGSDDYSFVSYLPAETGQLNYISALYEDNRGILWVGTEDGGLVMVVGRTKRVVAHYLPDPLNPASSPSNQITSIEEDQTGRLWLGTPAGLLSFDRSTGRFSRHINEPNNPRSLSSNYIRKIYRDRAGVLWVGTDGGGLNKLRPPSGSNARPEFQRYRYDSGEPSGLSDNGIESIFEDRSGVFWVGTYDNGLNKLILRSGAGDNRERRTFVHYLVDPHDPQSLSHASVNAFVEDSRGILWIGTDGGGLNRVTPPTSYDSSLRFAHYRARSGRRDGLTDDVVTAVCEDSHGDIWVGTYTGGLNRMSREDIRRSSAAFAHYRNDPGDPASLSANFVKVIHEDSLGTLWIGTIDGGLNRFDRSTGRFVRFQVDDTTPGNLSDNSVFAILSDRDGRLWIGTSEGLNRYDRQKNRFLHCKNDLADPASLSGDVVRALYCDRSGTIWVGMEGGGLNKLVSGADSDRPRFKHYRMKDGLPSDSVLGILEDDHGNLWLSTHNGLCRFDPRSETFRNYDQRDGLQGNDFRGGACWKSRSGEMFFGGSRGFNIFHPDQIRDNRNIPPIVILDFQIFNKPVPVSTGPEDDRSVLRKFVTETDQIELSHRDAVFSFEFAALHYVAPEKNEYAYWMEGLENEWNYVGNRRFVTYTTLPAGDYVFHVKGANSDGVWNDSGLALKITIRPPFWKTAWFSALVVVLALMFGLALFQLRVRQLKRRGAELEGQIEERTRQLGKANKQLSVANAKLKRIATRDELTGIANIRLFRTFLYREWRRVVRNGRPITLIMADVDFFKLYNDTYGHGAGDECLRKVAATIQKYGNRAGDLAARYGGEEFILVLSEAELNDAARVGEQIRRDVEALKIPHERSSISPYVTISLGCVTLIPDPKEKPARLLEEVDNALYLSKQEGRNRVTVRGMTPIVRQAVVSSGREAGA